MPNDPALLSSLTLAERAVPRYTSYPTAPHFTPAIGASIYARWLAALDPGATLSLYLHVPFCRALCHYCGCHTKAVLRPEPVEAYAERLTEEIALVAARCGSRRVVRIHWGGGTPGMLGEEALRRIVEALDAHFDLAGLVEHAIELDPRYVTPWMARTLGDIGVNRASLGVQELSETVQVAIGRVQPFELVRHAVDCLREAGIEQINLDLMYGLPHQTVADVRRTAALAITLAPQRIALFGYAHVPWFKPHQRLIDEHALPGVSDRLAQAETARRTLICLAYRPVGIDHFALPDDDLAIAAEAGRLRRNFQGYTADACDALIGFGVSAIGRLPQGYVQNARDLAGYSRAVAAGSPATVKGVAFDADDRLRGRIIEQLMCTFSVDLDRVMLDDGSTVAFTDDDALARLSELVAQALVKVHGRTVTVTERGRPFVRIVASMFDAYLQRAQARHSIAV
jgi:oxygen-independent coproporphyrinogen III oxidase